jgi:hypothetical protein
MIYEFEILYYKSKTNANVFGEISATSSTMRMNEKIDVAGNITSVFARVAFRQLIVLRFGQIS